LNNFSKLNFRNKMTTILSTQNFKKMKQKIYSTSFIALLFILNVAIESQSQIVMSVYYKGTGFPLTEPNPYLQQPAKMAFDGLGNLWVANSKALIASYATKITAANTGTNFVAGYNSHGVAVDASNNVYVNNNDNTLTKITAAGVSSSITSGLGNGDVVIDAAGNIYTANASDGVITKVTPAGVTNTTWASVSGMPFGLGIDAAGNLYTANWGAGTISKITPAGVVTQTWATAGTRPNSIAIDAAGNVYCTNESSNTVTKVTPAGVATAAWATTNARPMGITIDASGNLYVACNTANNITKITPAGVSSTFATLGAETGPFDVKINNGNLYVVPARKR
jgi:streptogramin lyase